MKEMEKQKFEIKHVNGTILFSTDTATDVKSALLEALKSGANLYGADLQRANLYGADLYGADLQRADLRGADLYGADLQRANLYGADLYGADLRGADLYGANLYGADLQRGLHMNWQSHQLLSEILFQAAGSNTQRRMIAGLIKISTDWCWGQFLSIETDPTLRDWALDELATWVTAESEPPQIIKDRIKE